MINYKPTPAQQPIHDDLRRVKLISGGEGSGKSFVTAAEYLAYYPAFKLALIVAPKYDSAYPEFDYIADGLMKLGVLTRNKILRPRKGSAVLTTVHGCRVITVSSEEGTKAITGTGLSPDLIMMVEAGKQPYDIYLACRLRVTRKRGYLLLSGTIERSERWYPELVTRWQAENPERARSHILPTWTNTYTYPGGENDPEILSVRATVTPDIYDERFGGKPCPPSTLVFKEFSFVDHVKPAPYWQGEWQGVPVEVAIDPGYAGAYAVLAIQKQADTVWVIDEVYRQYAVAPDIINECKLRPWWGLVRGGTMDVAGRQHQGMESHLEVWNNYTGMWMSSEYVFIPDGISRHRTFLRNPFDGKPRMFHDPRVVNMFREYGSYKYKTVVDGKPIDENPIDADNHAMKAIAYNLIHTYGSADEMIEKVRVQGQPSEYNRWAFTMR